MAESIAIPSPSVFLNTSPPALPIPAEQPERTRPRQIRRPGQPKKTLVSPSEQDARPKQSKSRNGCATCKAKRLKCDEEKPGCQQCARRNVECGGYKKDFKWRPFEETNVKINIDKRMKAVAGSPPKFATQASPSSSLSTPHSDSTATPPQTSAPSAASHNRKRSITQQKGGPINVTSEPLPPSRSVTTDTDTGQAILARETSSPDTSTAIYNVPPPGPLVTSPPIYSPHATGISAEQYFDPTQSSHSSYSAPTLSHSDTILSFDDTNHPDFEVLPPLDHLLDPSFSSLQGADDDIDEHSINFSFDTPVPHELMALQSQPSDLSDFFYFDFNATPLFEQPMLAEDSPEMLSLRFEKLTCGILSVIDGPTENPWRSLIWPLATQSPALYHAIAAMTAFHSSNDVPLLRLTGQEHKSASISHINDGIRNNSMSVQTAIATALALGFAESWDQHTASGNTHIKGAQALVKRALREHRKSPLHGEELTRLKSLCNAWVYMDVIARLTSVDSDDSNDFDNIYLFSTDPSQTSAGTNAGFGIDFGMPIDARLDPLMGCAGTLFPIIGRVANLVRKVCRSQVNTPTVISQGGELKARLEAWQCPAFIETPEDSSTQIMHSLQTAEAYRWATLLHLHQSVPEIPSESSAELAHKVLTFLATVPLSSRTVIVHIYPLMVAGCEAWSLEDRQWVRDRWAAMALRMRIGVIDKCIAVTEEVWQRKDAYEAQPAEQRKLVATAELQSTDTSQKSKRAHPTSSNVGPGRSGMVFTWIADGAEPVKSTKASKWPDRQCPKHVIGSMDPAYTVRGHLHWVGVMWDWGWEILLG